jgi:hypothetical protein
MPASGITGRRQAADVPAEEKGQKSSAVKADEGQTGGQGVGGALQEKKQASVSRRQPAGIDSIQKTV